MKKIFRENIQRLRIERGSRFLFLPKSLKLFQLAKIFLLESAGKIKEADEYLIASSVEILKEKKILCPEPVKYEKYEMGNISYHDVKLRTFDGQIYSRGTGIDTAESFAKAIGEVLERVPLKHPLNPRFEEWRVSEIKENKKFLSPREFAQATLAQKAKFPSMNIDEDDVFAFSEAEDIIAKEKRMIPTQTIFFGEFNNKREKKIWARTTNGAGAGYREEDVFRSGYLEILHRHVFLDFWYKKKPAQKIRPDSIPGNSPLFAKIKNFQNQGFKIHLLDFTQEAGIPTHVCFLEIFGGMYCGGSSDYSSMHSIERALDEAFSIYLWAMQANLEKGNDISQKFIDQIIPGFVDERLDAKHRVLLFAHSYFMEKSDRFFQWGEEVGYDASFDVDPNMEIKKLAEKKFGKNIFLYNSSHQILDEFGYFAGRVVIPHSYYFALNEIDSRPMLPGGEPPLNQDVNPFP